MEMMITGLVWRPQRSGVMMLSAVGQSERIANSVL